MTNPSTAQQTTTERTATGTTTVRGGWWTRARAAVRDGARVLGAPERRFELVAGMTLLLLLLYSEAIWYLEMGVYALAIVAVLHRPLVRRPSLWFLITGFLAVGHLRAWFAIDNHKYLITYWCLAIGLALLASDPMRTLRTSARWLIGLAFAFAVVAKLLSPDYLSGAFFEGIMLTDARFFGVASFLGGVPLSELQLGNFARQDLLVFGDLSVPVELQSSSRLAVLAQVLTWWTLFIEGVVAVFFLWPEDRGLSRWRDLTLLVFIATTYPVAPVIAFAWVLAAMGAAQSTRRGFPYWPALYVVAYVLVLLSFHFPFARFLPF